MSNLLFFCKIKYFTWGKIDANIPICPCPRLTSASRMSGMQWSDSGGGSVALGLASLFFYNIKKSLASRQKKYFFKKIYVYRYMKEITCRTCSRSSRPRSCCFGARRPPDELFSLIKKISFFKKYIYSWSSLLSCRPCPPPPPPSPRRHLDLSPSASASFPSLKFVVKLLLNYNFWPQTRLFCTIPHFLWPFAAIGASSFSSSTSWHFKFIHSIFVYLWESSWGIYIFELSLFAWPLNSQTFSSWNFQSSASSSPCSLRLSSTLLHTQHTFPRKWREKIFSFLPSERFKVLLLALRTKNSIFKTYVLYWEIFAKPTCVLHSSSSVLGCPAAFPPDGGRGPRPREGQGTVLMLLLRYSCSSP